MLFDQGKLEKMTITAYRPQTASCSDPPELSDAPDDTYVVQVNPESTALSHLQNYVDRQVPGSSGQDARFRSTTPTTLQLEFLFDGTGVIPPPSALGDIPLVGAIASALAGDGEFEVADEIAKLKRVAYGLRGESHRPPKLLLVWGQLDFPCVITSLEVRYTLFKPDGSPLRAIASCSFREWISDAERARRDNLTSPDLTHIREVREGDTLPLLAHRVYGDAALYLEVARVNKLVDFRRLEAGRRLRLPPVDKEAKR